MKGDAPISGIYNLGEPEATADPLEEWGRMERLRHLAWRRSGVIAVRAKELPHDLGQQLKAWAEENYGKR